MATEIKIFKEAIHTHLNVNDKAELISILAKPLLEKKYVTAEFAEKVLEREEKFPTGLPLKKIGVAIPHTDPKYVLKNAISIGVLKKPLPFKVMASPEQSVNVGIIFLLALNDSEKHLEILQKLISLIQNEKALFQILNGSKDEIFHFIDRQLKGGESSYD
ncbi:MAG: hypothetical protein C6P37_13195 [Caldibacillus debilis]|uniref:PTS EIIA type-2 domain-containing protein n=1 Tax=Caldibacillus debilis TaxID=301148 RepID=A0A3E0K179_9BACI|nr:PTS sugar transporter subunit IIA [Caldibacillus debilis]OUM83682.1 MAG: hypothetical protein BAA03_01680 [Caldibacillus debilis]REJ26661.1 MAG: hypothetical protein C6P37_13195 [Caldibacillus debilis]REJ28441.1 MAG: hypothetical protein C6W56_08230 [Caldibacillus debilis]